MIETSKFARKPFFVDAVQVTAENMEDVAKWCMGEVRTTSNEGSVEKSPEERYVKVRVHRPLTEKQTQAFVGDWVLYAGTGFKVYTPGAFDKSFEKVTTLTKAQADEAGIHPPIEKKPTPADLANSKKPTAYPDGKCNDQCEGGHPVLEEEDEPDYESVPRAQGDASNPFSVKDTEQDSDDVDDFLAEAAGEEAKKS